MVDYLRFTPELCYDWKQAVVDEGVSSLSIGVETFQAIEESQLKIEACCIWAGLLV